jgi:phosphoglycolate/pyridoxal phosphate phosphatase family enzyme
VQCRKLVEETTLFVFDCDGVLWRGSHLIPGVPAALLGLRKAGKTIAFITNNSTKTRVEFAEKFAKLGLGWVQPEQMLSSAFAAARYLADVHRLPVDRKVYVVGQAGLVDEIEAAGYTVLGGPAHAHWSLDKIPPRFEFDRSVGAVVVGFDRDINYAKLTYATMCAREIPDCLFLATNRDAITHLNNDQEFPGGGTMVAALEAAIGRPPAVAGKPASLLLDWLYRQHSMDRATARACMVGDRLDTDIVFGNSNGMTTLLVLSGVTRDEHLAPSANLAPEAQPTLVIESLATLAQVFEP